MKNNLVSFVVFVGLLTCAIQASEGCTRKYMMTPISPVGYPLYSPIQIDSPRIVTTIQQEKRIRALKDSQQLYQEYVIDLKKHNKKQYELTGDVLFSNCQMGMKPCLVHSRLLALLSLEELERRYEELFWLRANNSDLAAIKKQINTKKKALLKS